MALRFTLFLFLYVALTALLIAQTIPTPTQTGTIVTDNNSNGKADPNDRIRYKVTVQNTGGANATGVQLNVVPDAKTTVVSGSFRTSPLAINDTYACTGNVGLNVPAANGLKANDYDDAPAGLTILAETKATAQGGSVTLNTDGSFTYSPPAGYTGNDSFSYTLEDGNEVAGVVATDVGTVTLTISNMIWFVDNTGGGSGGNGTLANPFKTLAGFEAVNGNGGLNPAAGHTVFIKNSGTNYTGGVTLENNQILIGEGHTGTAAPNENLSVALSFSPAPFSAALPNIDGTRPFITNSTAGGILLASGNSIRGVDAGTTAAGDYAIRDNGATVGSLTISEVAINNALGAFRTAAGGTLNVTFSSITATSGGAVNGVYLINTSGTFTGGTGSISGMTGTPVLINGGSVTFTYSGNVSQSNNADMIAVTGGHAAGTVTFQTGTLNATNGTGLQFDNADGTYNFNGTTTLNGGDAGIDILNGSTGSFTFGTATSITRANNITGAAFNLASSNANVTYNGSMTLGTGTGNMVAIDNHDAGTINFNTGSLTKGSSTTQGISIQNSGGGTINFNNPTIAITMTSGNAVSLTGSNAGGTVNFAMASGGNGLDLTTTSGIGFNSTGGGTISVTGTGNTITSTTGTALNVANTTIGANNLNFQSISSNGAANGIVVNNTGTSGGLTVTGTGSTGTGGTIQNSTGAGVSLTTTSKVNLSYMNIQGNGDDGIAGTTVTDFTLANCTVTNNGNSTIDEGIEFTNLLGTSTINNCTVTNNAHNNFKLDNANGTMTSLTVSNSTFEGHNNGTAFGNHGFLFEARLSAVIAAVSITGSFFKNNFSIGMQVITGDNATISDFVVSGCTFSDTGTGNSQEIAADFSTAQTSNMTYRFLNNTLTGHNSNAFNTFTAAGAGTGGSLTGTIENNTIGSAGTIDSGSKIGNGMRININGGANARIKINNNLIHQIPVARGIECISRNGTGGASFIVTNNTITAPTGTTNAGCGAGVLCPLAPIHVQTNDATIGNNACSVVSGNTAYNPTSVGLGGEYSVQLLESNTSTLNYEGNPALSALQNLTNANPNCVTKNVLGSVTVVAAGTCPIP
ncbi:MAG: Ig-like domain-containing protein [Spirosomataceae bacterium]